MPYHKKSAPSSHRPYYSDSVKRRAVHDVLVKHQTQSSVAERMQCSINSLYNWIKRFRHESEAAASTKRKHGGGGRKGFPKDIRRAEIRIDLPDEEKHCADCGNDFLLFCLHE